MRRAPRRERGVVLVAFTAMLAALLLVGTLGWMATMTRAQLSKRLVDQATYISGLKVALSGYLQTNFKELSEPAGVVTSDAVLKGANISTKWGMQLYVSDVLTSNGLPYRSVVAYLPTDTDDRNPPNLEDFKTTGRFTSCADPTGPCETRKFVQVSTLSLQQTASQVTQSRLQAVAALAQLYFKRRVLQDPERRVTVNYFRPTSGSCALLHPRDLPCADIQLGLTSSAAAAQFVQKLALSPELLRDGWGDELTIVNGPAGSLGPSGPETMSPPFSMEIHARARYGSTLKSVATQPLQ